MKKRKLTVRYQAQQYALYSACEALVEKADEVLDNEDEIDIYEEELERFRAQLQKVTEKALLNERIDALAEMRPELPKTMIRQAVKQGKMV